MSKSSRKSSRKILGMITAARAEQILTEWVNTDLGAFTEDANAWERLFRRDPEILSAPIGEVLPCCEANFGRFHQQMEMASSVGADLARAWDAVDLRHFEWYTWKAQMHYEFEAANARHKVTHLEMSEDVPSIAAALIESEEPPAIITPVEAAIFHLRHNRRRALHCPNTDCPAPYFFANKKGQKYCSAECAKPSQRESKRRWWADNRAKKARKNEY